MGRVDYWRPHISRQPVVDNPARPLGCDCYPGCWADHSHNWPGRITVTEHDKGKFRELRLWCRDNVAYGMWVIMSDHIRFASLADCDTAWADIFRRD